MCGVGLPNRVSAAGRRGIGSGQRGVRPASPSCCSGVMLLDDAAGIRVIAQLDLVVGATDPGPGRLIRRAAVEIVIEGDGYLRRRRGVPAGDGAACTVAGYLPCRDQPQRPGRRCPPVPGSQRRQSSGHARRQPAMVGAGSWPVRPHPAISGDAADAPEKPYVADGGVARARKSGPVRRGAGLGLLPPDGAAGRFRCWQLRERLGRFARS
jgi:hypothetical protein